MPKDTTTPNIKNNNLLMEEKGKDFQTYTIRRVRLVNFHNFQNETIEIKNGGHLFLLGDNASGKTTILDAVHYVLSAGRFMEFNSAARVAGRGAGGRRPQGIVMRYNVDTGPLNKDGGVSYAAIELSGRHGKPLTLGLGLAAYSMEERIQRWGIIKEAPLESIPWLMEEEGRQRVTGLKEMRELIEGGFYNIGAYEKELARRLYGSEEIFAETCRFMSMGKAYREIAAGAGDYHELFKSLLPEPKTDLFDRIIDTLKSLDESRSLLEDMNKKYLYLTALVKMTVDIDDAREAMARYHWLLCYMEAENLLRQKALVQAKAREASALLAELQGSISTCRRRREHNEARLLDLKSRDTGGVVRQERDLSRDLERRRARQAPLAVSVDGCRGLLKEITDEVALLGKSIYKTGDGLGSRLRTLAGQWNLDTENVPAQLEALSPSGNLAECFSVIHSEPLRQKVEDEIRDRQRGVNECEFKIEGLRAQAHTLDKAIAQLETKKELHPALPGYNEALNDFKDAGIKAQALYELLEWSPRLSADDRSSVEALIGEEVLGTFVVGAEDYEAARELLLGRYSGLRLCKAQSSLEDLPHWERNAFSTQDSHPAALVCLAQEMTTNYGPDFGTCLANPTVAFRAHERQLGVEAAQWVGPEARKRALEQHLHALQTELQTLSASREEQEARMGLLQTELSRLEEFRAAINTGFSDIGVMCGQWSLLKEKQRNQTERLEAETLLLKEVEEEIGHLQERLGGLREIIKNQGLETIEEEIRVVEKEQNNLEEEYTDFLQKDGACREQKRVLAQEEDALVKRYEQRISDLEKHSAQITALRPEVEDAAYYVLRTRQGANFKGPDHVEASLRESERRESGLQGALSEKLNDPVYGAVFGFSYQAQGNALTDRRDRPVADLAVEQQKAIAEQEEVINEKTNELFKKIIVNEMVRFFSGHISRLESMVHRINILLSDKLFGNTRYRLELTREDRFKPFIEAIHKFNPFDNQTGEVLRQFIEDHKDDILNSEVDSVPAALDYRNWYTYNLKMFTAGDATGGQAHNPGVVMDRHTKSMGSGGEQAVPNYLTILTITHFLFGGNRIRVHALLFDEAFYGIDAGRRDQLLAFADDLGLQLLVASPDQDGVKREIRNSTTLLVVKDENYDVHLYPFHWKNLQGEQIDLLNTDEGDGKEVKFTEELGE